MDQHDKVNFTRVLRDLDILRKRSPVNAKFLMPLWDDLEKIPKQERQNFLVTLLLERTRQEAYLDITSNCFQEARAIWHIILNQEGFGRHNDYIREVAEKLTRADSKTIKTNHA